LVAVFLFADFRRSEATNVSSTLSQKGSRTFLIVTCRRIIRF